MRFRLRLIAFLLIAGRSTPAEAQSEYFTNGGVGGGFSGAIASGEGQRAVGAGLEVLFTPKVGMALGFSQSRAVSDFEEIDVNVVSIGLQAFPARQGIDGPVTLGVSFGLGLISEVDAKAINVGVQAAHVIGSAAPGIQLVPKAELALVLALAETTAAASQAVGVGMGIALRGGAGFVLFVEPNASLSFGSGESRSYFGAAFGVGFSI